MFSGLFHLSSYQHMNFEDIQIVVKAPESFLLINTLPATEQDCLIPTTTPYHMEENLINGLMEAYQFKAKSIVIYGRNSADESAEKKCKQLVGLGFQSVFLYDGGMFEWLLLQDIYGSQEFPTTIRVLDLLKYKPPRKMGGARLMGF